MRFFHVAPTRPLAARALQALARPALVLPALVLPALVLLAGCADDGRYPSLAPRAIEGLAARPEREATAPVRTTDPALEAQVATLAAQVTAADRAWQAGLSATRAAIAQTGSRTAQSEAWIRAQQAIGRLDQLRGAMAAAVEALDRLRIAQADNATPADTNTLDALWTRATGLAAAQAATYADVAAVLPIS